MEIIHAILLHTNRLENVRIFRQLKIIDKIFKFVHFSSRYYHSFIDLYVYFFDNLKIIFNFKIYLQKALG